MDIKRKLLFLALPAALISCKKSGQKPAPATVTGIFVTGIVASASSPLSAAYWQNNNPTVLPGNYSQAAGSAIAVTGNGNIYVAGYEYVASKASPDTIRSVATYWANNIPIGLADSTKSSWATGICIYNGDVYVTGVIASSNGTNAACWKNGLPVPLKLSSDITSSEALGVTVSNGDVYVVGNTFTPSNAYVTYWKNGVQYKVTSPGTYARATAIAVNGQDIYIAGNYGEFQTSAAYWKNGVLTVLTGSNVNAATSAIQVQNNNVYISGIIAPVVDGQLYYLPYSFIYWKNGSVVNTDWANYSAERLSVGAMAVVDTNVYVAGCNGTLPVYWNNGKMTSLSASQGTASGIAVVRN